MKTKIVFCLVSIAPILVLVSCAHQMTKPLTCWPDKVFVQKMELLVERAPLMWRGDIPFRSIEVGRRYHEGDVAYFVRGGVEEWIQLEEWRKRQDKVYQLATWVCGPMRAETWSLALSPEDGQLMDDNKIVWHDLEITSPEAIEKSEKIQNILGNAFPN